MRAKLGPSSDRLCLASKGQDRVSRIRVVWAISVSGARHGGRQPKLPKHRLYPADPLGGCCQSEAGLVTDHAWPSVAKLGFLSLGFLGLTQSQVSDKDRHSPPGRNLA